jgi:hypothetical protein
MVIASTFLAFTSATQAKVIKDTNWCQSGKNSIECRVIETRTNYRDDGSGDWVKSSDAYQFRSKDGSKCKVRGNLTSASNTKMTYTSTYVNSSGDWSKPGLVAEQRKEGQWQYRIRWEFECR